MLVNELRAVGLLLDRVEDGPELTLLVDSLTALRFLRAWHDAAGPTPEPAGRTTGLAA